GRAAGAPPLRPRPPRLAGHALARAGGRGPAQPPGARVATLQRRRLHPVRQPDVDRGEGAGGDHDPAGGAPLLPLGRPSRRHAGRPSLPRPRLRPLGPHPPPPPHSGRAGRPGPPLLAQPLAGLLLGLPVEPELPLPAGGPPPVERHGAARGAPLPPLVPARRGPGARLPDPRLLPAPRRRLAPPLVARRLPGPLGRVVPGRRPR